MEDAVAEGISSFKMFTAFQEGSALGGLYMDDGRIWGVMQSASRLGATVMLHCEDDCIVDYHMRLLERDGLVGGEHIAEARPPLAEEAAISRMLLLARRSGVPLYVVHVSTAEGVRAIAEARARGQRVYGETLHNYLVFTADAYRRPNGLLFNNYPPLRSSTDQDALWRSLGDGSALDTVASDDVAVTMEAKLRGSRIDDLPGGHNGVETRMQVLFSEGVSRRRLSIERFVQLTAANPARLFGLHPRKGAIAVGSDADLVMIDPEREVQFRLSDLHSDADFSIWDGWRGKGRIRATIARGEVLVMDGEWIGSTGRGQFVPAATA
jgi:dihydropyrimidinase